MKYFPGQRVRIARYTPCTPLELRYTLGQQEMITYVLDHEESIEDYSDMYPKYGTLYSVHIEHPANVEHAIEGIVCPEWELEPLTLSGVEDVSCQDILDLPKDVLKEADAPLPEKA